MHKIKHIRRFIVASSVVTAFGLSVVSLGVVQAATTPTPVKTKTDTSTTAAASSQASTAVQAYTTDTTLQIGTMVQLDGKSTSKVVPATIDKAAQMFGVTVDPQSLSVTISAGGANQSYVATSGTYKVLVSSQNGPIKSGDYVTISSISGIGMKANPEQLTVFGRAAASFDGKSNLVGSAVLKDTTGKETAKIAISTIPVVINIQHNPEEKSTKANVPKPLQRLGEAIAEKPVGPLRIYLSIAITGISVVAAIILLYAGVKNSIISIGRNPLGKKSIFRALIEIILTSIIVLIIGLFAVYLLLKL